MSLYVVDDCEEALNSMARDAELNRIPEREIWEQDLHTGQENPLARIEGHRKLNAFGRAFEKPFSQVSVLEPKWLRMMMMMTTMVVMVVAMMM